MTEHDHDPRPDQSSGPVPGGGADPTPGASAAHPEQAPSAPAASDQPYFGAYDFAPPTTAPSYSTQPYGGYGGGHETGGWSGGQTGGQTGGTGGWSSGHDTGYATAPYGSGGGGGYGGGYAGSGPEWSTGSYGYGAPPTGTWGAPPVTGPSAADRPRHGRLFLGAAAVAAVVGAAVGGGVAAAVSNGGTRDGAVAVSTQAAPAAKLDGTVSAAAGAIKGSVVTINVAAGNSGGTGSGFVIKTSGDTGYILTNNHVVTLDSSTSANNDQITVTLPTGNTVDASVVGTDPSDDLAVIKVTASGLKVATFAKSSALTVGQTVVAMGAPLGLSNTVTSGIVSALARPVATGTTQNAAIFNAVQTDAAINPGNSGGPLVDLNGHVVGVNSAIAGTGSGSSATQSGNIGIGFAIPSDEASRIASELIATGKATHAVLGITVSGANQQSTAPTSGSGAPVASVQSGSPADKAGIKSGDVITKIGDQRIDDSVGAIAATRSFAPGTTVSVTVVTNGQSHTVQVTLGSSTDN